MESVRGYILSVICVGILCALVQLLVTGSGSVQSVIRFVSGIVLSVCVITPALDLENIELNTMFDTILADRQWIVEEGKQAAANELSQSLKEQTQAYILSKADAMGMAVRVDVTVSNTVPPIPESVTIIGSVSPYGKMQLSQYISTELGIEKEHQIWNS